ncbi:hypothetical protein ROZALSC1DRAFT_30143 [Rozella allomycis CSF55]|uniref:Zinc finger, RING-type domain-containing protein n=1 Tax=Rozella allomycis (strain CSF55) TaxID=988480 RepID=A0A075AMN8_ROZAC|nr:Zinc finger, RING-type domain-containing protein [Rozella allomycis CSF55]RKP18124.1 hypothetical protein ROZALSC1DRAFT_30143 [Rozella allomycis CSF55]|eukprot:EPZ30939.1 Zinc finger, RING-type domain-containing protein [Rozella allomycis CSF55]
MNFGMETSEWSSVPIRKKESTKTKAKKYTSEDSVTKKFQHVQCKFFMQGGCINGKNCPFLHVVEETEPIVCKYFLKGKCKYGKHCSLSHKLPVPAQPKVLYKPEYKNLEIGDNYTHINENENLSSGRPNNSQLEDNCTNVKIYDENSEDDKSFNPWESLNESKLKLFLDAADNGVNSCSVQVDARVIKGPINVDLKNEELCPFALTGNCKYNTFCRFVHGEKCPHCNRFCLHPYNDNLKENHLKNCQFTCEGVRKDIMDEDIECGICYEKVMSKKDSRFGLLNCNHAFCLGCIRTWRSKISFDSNMEAMRSCPICRQVTHFVTPSSLWIADPLQKATVIENYKKQLSQIPCKHFNKGDGDCPFGTSCFYSHTFKDGTVDNSSYSYIINSNEEIQPKPCAK